MQGKLLLLFLVIALSFILVCRSCTFPLAAGSLKPGLIATMAIKNQTLSRPQGNYPLAAVIVEPREENLVNIVQHFLRALPETTHFQIYHGTKNREVLNEFQPLIESGKISLWNLGVENLNSQSYSALLTSEEFWHSVQAEKVLIFQTDAIPCSQSTVDLQQFASFDYVGAPLQKHIRVLLGLCFGAKGHLIGHSQYYNGGLSWRSKSKMLDVIKHYPWDQLTPEDIWFCAFLPKVGGRMPNLGEARQFSFEAEKLTTVPWGLHKPRKQYDQLCKVCPEVRQIPYIPSHTDYRNLFLV